MKKKPMLPSPFDRFKTMQRGERNHPFAVMQEEMNRMFERFWDDTPWPVFGNGWRRSYPSVDVKESDKSITVSAELPGMSKQDVCLTLDRNMLTIQGDKHEEKEEKQGGAAYRERRYGAFHRTIPFPCEVDSESAKATFKNGVLKITINKTPEVKRNQKRIAVQ